MVTGLGLGLRRHFRNQPRGAGPQPVFEYDHRAALPAGISFARASVATYFDSLGVLRTADVGSSRQTFDPNSLVALGLMIEAAHTNQATPSDAYVGTGGFLLSAAVVANTTSAPDGQITADKLQEDTSAATTHSGTRGAPTVADSTNFLHTCFLKAAERTTVHIQQGRKDVTFPTAIVDMANRTVSDGALAFTTKWLERCQNGWMRVALLTSSSTGASNLFPQQFLRNAAGETSYTGDGASGHYIWGYDIGVGEYPTSYVPTVSGSVTRAAETASETRNLGAEYTVVLRFRTAQGAGTQYLWSSDDGTANERVYIFRNSSRELHVVVVDGAAGQADLNMGTIADATDGQIAVRVNANDIAASLNGAAVVTDTSATIPTTTTLRFGHDHAGANQWDGTLQYSAAYGTGRPDNELRSLTGWSFAGASITAYPTVDGLAGSGQYTVTVNGVSVPTTKYNGHAYAWFAADFPNSAEIVVGCGATVTSHTLSPQRAAISTTASGSNITFTLSAKKYVALRVNSIAERLFIFADNVEASVPASSGAGIYNVVSTYGAPNNNTGNATTAIQAAIDAANTAGGGIVYVPAGQYRCTTAIFLKSNVSMYLAPGSTLHKIAAGSYSGSVFLHIDDTTNSKLYGRGVINGNGLTGGSLVWHIISRNANNLIVEDIMTINPVSTAIRMHGGSDGTWRNLKVISWPSALADGIDIECTTRYTMDGCFVQSTDDNFAIGSGSSVAPVITGATDDLTMKNCLQVMGQGHSVSLVPRINPFTYTDILYDNNDAIILTGNSGVTLPPDIFAIYPFGGSDVDRVTFSNSRFEAGTHKYDFVIWAQDCSGFGEQNCGQPAGVLGHVRTITYQNLTIDTTASGGPECANQARSLFLGWDSTSNIASVTVDNVSIAGVHILSDGQLVLCKNSFVAAVTYV